MAAFGFEADNCATVHKFMDDTSKRLNLENFIKNPFRGGVKQIDENDVKISYAVVMKPLYFEFYYMGLLWLGGTLFFSGLTWSLWLLPGIIMYSLGIFWSSHFYYLLLRWGLRKVGYKGQIRRISKEDIISHIIKS